MRTEQLRAASCLIHRWQLAGDKRQQEKDT